MPRALLLAGLIVASSWALAGAAPTAVFLDFDGVTGDGFYDDVGSAGITADVSLSNSTLVQVATNPGLSSFGDLDDQHSFNSNPGPNGGAGPDGTVGNNTYATAVRGLFIKSNGPAVADVYTATLSDFSEPPRVIWSMNIGSTAVSAGATLNVRSGGADLDFTAWPRYQDTNPVGTSILETLISYAGGVGTLTCNGAAQEQSNGLFVIVPTGILVDQITFTGRFSSTQDQQLIGVSLDPPAGRPALGGWGQALLVALLLLVGVGVRSRTQRS